VHFKQLKGLLNEITKVVSFSLRVINLVAHVQVLGFEEVHDWKNLSVVWHKSFSNCITACNKSLQDFKGNSNNLGVTSVQGSLNRDNQLWNDWEDLGTSDFEEIEDTLDGKESVGINLFADTLEENGEIVMVVELLSVDFPTDFILRTVFNCNGEVTSVVEESKLAHRDLSAVDGASSWFLRNRLLLGLVERSRLATKSIALFENCSALSSDRDLLLVDWLNCGYTSFLFLHVLGGEVTKGRVLSSGKIGVVVRLPCLGSCFGQALLKVVLDKELRGGTNSADSIGWLHICHSGCYFLNYNINCLL